MKQTIIDFSHLKVLTEVLWGRRIDGLYHSNLAAALLSFYKDKDENISMDFFFSLSSTVHSLFSCLPLRLVSEWWRLLFHVFCFTQKENWLAVSSRYNAAFQMGDLIYPQKLWVLFAKYAYRRFNSVHGVLCFPVVHCGIRQSDLLHVKSQAFEGFLGFCFENVTLNLCFHLKHSSFHVTAQTCLSTRRFLRKLIQDWP